MNKVGFIYSPEFEGYSFGSEHPFNSKRLVLTVDLLKKSDILFESDIIVPPYASMEDLLLGHDREYIAAVENLSKSSQAELLGYGLGSEDTPIFPKMHQTSARIVGGTLLAAKLVMEGRLDHAVNLAGGLHHAMHSKASGFCIYNDAVVGISYLRKHYGARVAYIDIDAHHGDGVQEAFYDDPNVLTISIHETGRYLFPGTGHVQERGIGAGYGYAVNVPLDAFTEDDSWLKTFAAVTPVLVESFKPDIIFLQNGCDSHAFDPLTHLCCSTHSFATAYKLVHMLAHRVCKGKLVALGGGGYDYWRVVPRAWTLLWSELTQRHLPNSIPQAWLTTWEEEAGLALPKDFQDNMEEFEHIPRRAEIEERNQLTVQKVLDSNGFHLNKFL